MLKNVSEMAKSWLQNYQKDENHKKKDSDKATSSTATKSRRGKQPSKVITCQVCQAQFDSTKEPMLISCVSCEPKTYFCIDCIEMTEDEYTFMQRPDCFWSCPDHATALTKEKNPIALMSEMVEKISKIDQQLSEANKVESYMSNKMKEFEEKIEEKLNRQTKELSTEVPKVVKNSWAQMAGNSTSNAPPTDFRKVVKEALDTQKKEEAEKDQREMNVIIYRAKESAEEDSEKQKEEDEKYFEGLCVDALGIGEVAVKDIRRLGKPDKEKTRPLRVTLEHKSEKELIMKNAKELAEAEDKFKSISISHDYSKEERAKIKEKEDEAKELQKNDLNHVFKVRGPPWDLRIKKFEKRNQ